MITRALALAFLIAAAAVADGVHITGRTLGGAQVDAAGTIVTAAADGSFTVQRDTLPDPQAAGTRRNEVTLKVTSPGHLASYAAATVDAKDVQVPLLKTAPADEKAPPPQLSIAQYLNDRRGVVTPTFDDTLPSHVTTVRMLFDEMGYRCSFYINSAKIGPGKPTTWDQWRDIHRAGYEIGNHTLGHWLKLPQSQENDRWNRNQIQRCFDDISREIGVPPPTFAFPGGGESEYTRGLLKETLHLDHRHNVHKTKGDRIYPEGDTLTVEKVTQHIDEIMAHKKAWHGGELSWFLFYMHDVTPPREQVLRTMLQYIQKHDDQVWCTTYTRATMYERCREAGAITVTGSTPDSVTFTVTHKLDERWNTPLTVVIRPATKATSAIAFRDAKASPVELRLRQGRILLNIVPGAEPVTVRWQ